MNLKEAIDARDPIAAGLSTFPAEFLRYLKVLGVTGPCTGYTLDAAGFNIFYYSHTASLFFENKGRWFLLRAVGHNQGVVEIGYDPRACRQRPCDAGGQCTCDNWEEDDDDDWGQCAYCGCDCDTCNHSYACATHGVNHPTI